MYDRDPEAVGQVSLASLMAGIAFNMNANAIVHAASTPVTARHGVPHGVANAIFLPAGLDFLRPACEPKLREIAIALGADVGGLDVAGAAPTRRRGRPLAAAAASSCPRRCASGVSTRPTWTSRHSWRTQCRAATSPPTRDR